MKDRQDGFMKNMNMNFEGIMSIWYECNSNGPHLCQGHFYITMDIWQFDFHVRKFNITLNLSNLFILSFFRYFHSFCLSILGLVLFHPRFHSVSYLLSFCSILGLILFHTRSHSFPYLLPFFINSLILFPYILLRPVPFHILFHLIRY